MQGNLLAVAMAGGWSRLVGGFLGQAITYAIRTFHFCPVVDSVDFRINYSRMRRRRGINSDFGGRPGRPEEAAVGEGGGEGEDGQGGGLARFHHRQELEPERIHDQVF